jgi:hypothetical protein
MTRIDRTPEAEPPTRRRRKWLLLLPLLLLLIWWLWPNGRLAKARELQNELFAQGTQLSPDDRRTKFEELRNVTRGMSDAQRRELSEDRRKRMEDELRKYIQSSPAEKQQRLDHDIHRQEERRQNQNNAGGGGRPNGFGGGGPNGQGRPSTPEDRERWRQQRLDQTTPEMREMRDQYRRDLNARRQQMGLPPMPTRPMR